jgi:hypothetical protein
MKQCNVTSLWTASLRETQNEIYRPEPALLDPNEFVAPRNSFAMSFQDFLPHLMNVLDQLGMSVHARTDFIKYVPLCPLILTRLIEHC